MQLIRSCIYTGLLIAVTFVAAIAVLVAAALPLSLGKRYVIPIVWGRTLTWLCGVVVGLKYTVEGQENLPKEPFVSLWKHSSTWEVLAQMFVVPPASWSLKAELLKAPLLGWAVACYQPIGIDRKGGGSAVNQMVAQGRERLAAGLGVIVYPEGTRMPPGQTRKYGIAGALLATETGAPVVPIAHNAGYFWPRQSLLKKPGMVRVVIGPPIDPKGLTPREVNERAQQWIEAKIAEIVAEPGGQPR
jgi:1-acyl-sn-glycerol-3-phosphate acyltransferase